MARLVRSGESCCSFDAEESGVVFVGAELMMSVIKSGTVAGVTFSMIVKDGSSNTVVEPSTSGDSGTGILQADSMSFWRYHSPLDHHSSQPPPLCCPSRLTHL